MKRVILGLTAATLVLTGCHTDMWRQPKTTTYKENELFSDGKSARPLETGVVARGHLKTDSARFKGKDANGNWVNDLPASLTLLGEKVDSKKELKKVLLHGQERYNIFCSHCHGKNGDGDGMITQRGLVLRRKPATYHTDRLRKMDLGYFYDVATDGFGTMYGHKTRTTSDDRWAIVAYLRTLQLSKAQTPGSLTEADRKAMAEMAAKKLEEQNAKEKGGGH